MPRWILLLLSALVLPLSAHAIEAQPIRAEADGTQQTEAPASEAPATDTPSEDVLRVVNRAEQATSETARESVVESGKPVQRGFLVVDASGSMAIQRRGVTKLDVARRTLEGLLEKWGSDAEVGLMAFGRQGTGCDDIETLVPLGEQNAGKVLEAMGELAPRGATPLTAAIRSAAGELHSLDPSESRIVVLSDWQDTCQEDPCQLVDELDARGIRLTAYVVAFNIVRNPSARQQLHCLAEQSGGTFEEASDFAELGEAVGRALGYASGQLPLPLAAKADTGTRIKDLELGLRWEYIPVEPFEMGSPEDEPGRDADEALHEVVLPRDFWITATEITRGAWQKVMGRGPYEGWSCPECPVDRVSFFDALLFANRLSVSEGLEPCYQLQPCYGEAGSGCPHGEAECAGEYTCTLVQPLGSVCSGYRLPSAAEWEYAARAGTETPFWQGEELTSADARCAFEGSDPSSRHAVAVATFPPNPFGLSEVHGNLWEWVWPDQDQDAATRRPERELRAMQRAIFNGQRVSAPSAKQREVRGGSFSERPQACRAANRETRRGGWRYPDVGLRLVRSEP